MSDHESCDRYLEEVKSELREAKEEIQKLRSLLLRYGDHTPMCTHRTLGDCNCDWMRTYFYALGDR